MIMETPELTKTDLRDLRKAAKTFPPLRDRRIAQVIDLRREIDRLEAQLDTKKKLFELFKEQVGAQLKGCGVKSGKNAAGDRVTLVCTVKYSAKKADRRDFAERYRLEDALTLGEEEFSKFAREWLATGSALPTYVSEFTVEKLQIHLKKT